MKKGELFSDILERRLSRRGLLQGASAMAVFSGLLGARLAQGASQADGTSLGFSPASGAPGGDVRLPKGYRYRPLLRWGDPILRQTGVPLPALNAGFSIGSLTADAQRRSFGFNCDFNGYFPLPWESKNPNRGLLATNHEYSIPSLMFLDYDENTYPSSKEQVDIEIAAHGMSIVEIRRDFSGQWAYERNSFYNRRILGDTAIMLSGAAAGDAHMRTKADSGGQMVLGMLGNCAGGKTPWGTVLTCEENFHGYFGYAGEASGWVREVHDRYGVPEGESDNKWERYYERFDVRNEPNEPLRFGWVVEINPYDPTYRPRKRTALGRFKHEGATVSLSQDGGRPVVYMGDDERFEYVYKFVSNRPFNPMRREANGDCLDDGVLYAARFNDDGTGQWLPLVHGSGPLTQANGLASQAEVLINARKAADLLGATQMDRPEDIETNPYNGKVYMVMTKNDRRTAQQVNASNPRAKNTGGHIIELSEDGGDPAATHFTWEMFLVCGRPDDPSTYFAGFPKDLVSPIACPDNLALDSLGNLWVCTDGAPDVLQENDGVFAVPVDGPERGHVRRFLAVPDGAEATGPEFSTDYRTFFLSVQHPGEDGTAAKPQVHWPDGGESAPRPTVIAVTKEGSGVIGS